MAERAGFEPADPKRRSHQISNLAHSATLPPLRMTASGRRILAGFQGGGKAGQNLCSRSDMAIGASARIRRSLVGAGFSVIPLAPLAIGQETSVAPSDLDRHLEATTRAMLELADPSRDTWESEERGARAQSRLTELARLLQSELGSAALEPLVGEGFSCSPLRPNTFEDVFDEASHLVRRASSSVGEVEEGRGPVEFARALGALVAVFDQPPRVEFKTHRVIEGSGDSFETESFYTACGESEEGLIQANAIWRCRWSADAFRLLSVHARDYEEVLAPSGRTVFVDAPLAGLKEPEAWLLGIGELRERLDTRLGLPILGHPAGIAVGDVNGDEFEDLYLCQPGGFPNRLLLHGPDHSFVDASSSSGADFLDYSRSALLIDLDGDRDRDLAVTVFDELLLLANDGSGRFSIRASHPANQATSLAAADIDLDDDLDLYVCSYFDPYSGEGAAVPLPYFDAQNGEPNHLLENRGDFEFVDTTAARGLDAGNRRFTFAAAFEDYDRDGDPDLYVANDFGRNNLYRNDEGRFADVAGLAGVEDSASGMGVSWGDYDNDGWTDLYVSNMFSAAGNRVVYQRRFQPDATPEVRASLRHMAQGNALFRNLGDGTFADVSEQARVAMARWAWGAVFVDWNADGRIDIVSPNGFLTQPKKDDL